MGKILIVLISIFFFTNCEIKGQNQQNIFTSDIHNFWAAYDKITSTNDSVQQYRYLEEIYFDKGTKGLNAIMGNRGYTPNDYLDAINNYPKFWSSIRANTVKAETFSSDIEKGIEKLKKIYPDLQPAKIYFTIGALRTGGTTTDDMVLIGSEIAMADKNTITSEFPEEIGGNRREYFDTNPIDDLVLLNIHEYVHTQQNPIVHNLLSYSMYEGVAEFVSVKAMNTGSSTPAIEFGKSNEEVKKKFEEEMFYGNNINEWLWSDAENEFGIRDLGYYIGYQIAELFYEQADDKRAAIKKMIELDYTNETEIQNFVDSTGFFSASLDELHKDFQKRRPTVIAIRPFENRSQNVHPRTTQITIEFSDQMNQSFRNFDYGPLGEDSAIRFKKLIGYSENGKSLTFEIEDLEPNKLYQLTIGSGFRNLKGVPLEPFLIEFKTKAE